MQCEHQVGRRFDSRVGDRAGDETHPPGPAQPLGRLGSAEGVQDLGLAVNYPGLPDHPDHELFSRLHCPDYGYGGLLTLDMGSTEMANKLMDMLQNDYRFGYMAVSLGYFDTLMSCSGSTTSSEMTEEDKIAAGIVPGLVRMSVGITGSAEQRWSQLKSALDRLGVTGKKPHGKPGKQPLAS